MIVETVRLSEKARNQLIQVKRKTGIEQWNILCRWGLILSLAEKHPPPPEDILTDSSIEIAWKTFAGSLDSALSGLTRYKFKLDRAEMGKQGIENFFKLHLHRGISYLANKELRSVASIFE